MKKIIVAVDNKKILNKIKEISNLKIILKNVQYREAILEILKKEKNMDFIFINEKLSGEISIEELINKIKRINKKINIIFFLEKDDIKKENKLKKLGIENIYIINKINSKEILNLLEGNKLENIEKTNKKSKYLINKKNKYNKFNNKINKKDNKNKIITIYGEPKSGKSTIINLLIIYLREKNKKILLINLNKRPEKNYFILLNKKYLKNKKTKNNILEKNKKIKINKNLTIIDNFEKSIQELKEKNIEEKFRNLIEKLKKCYDYILFDISQISNTFLKHKIIEESNKKVIVIDKDLLGIQKIRELFGKKEKESIKYDSSLHIIQNRYFFNSISNLILKNIFKDFCKVHKILYSKSYVDLSQKILKNKKVKIKRKTKNILEKIIN